MARRLTRGDVCLHRFDAPDKERPVIVMTRSLSIPRLNRVTVVPVTLTIRGTPAEVLLDETDGMEKACVANVNNIVTIPKRELGRRLTALSPERIGEVCKALRFALACGEPESHQSEPI